MNKSNMLKWILAGCLAALGWGATATAQQADAEPQGRGRMMRELRNLPPQEREQLMQEWRNLSPQEREQRIQQWRVRREQGDTPAAVAAPAQPLGERPEAYIDRWQFRSVLSLGGATQYSLQNPWDERNFWAAVGDRRHEIEVVSHDSEANTITIRHGEETRVVPMTQARVVALAEQPDQGAERRAERDAQREQFRQFMTTWQQAALTDPRLREIETQFRELGQEFARIRQAERDLPDDSPQREQIRQQQRALFEEARLLGEYSMAAMRNNPAFAGHDLDGMERRIMRLSGQRDLGERRRRGDGDGGGR